MTLERTEFRGDTFTFNRDYSMGETCDKADFRFAADGTFVIPDENMPIAGALPIDVTWKAVSLVIENGETARAFNEMKVCGLDGWQAHVARDVSGRLCDGLQVPTSAKSMYLMFKIEGDHCYPGDINSSHDQDGTSHQRRPQRLDQAGASHRVN